MRKAFVLSIFLSGLVPIAPVRADDAAPPAAPAQDAPAAAQVTLDADALKALDARISELEAQSLLNHFHFGGYFTYRFDAIEYRPENDAARTNHAYPMSMRLALNVDVDISDEVKFYSTLGMSKLANMAFSKDAPGAMDLVGSYNRSSPQVYVDRAYLEYRPRFLPAAFAAGRLPTVDGPPSHLWDGEPRLGTYPMTWFNAIADGLSLTLNLGKLLPEGHSLFLRGVYAPAGQYDIARPYKQVESGGKLYPTQFPAGSGMLEYGVKNKLFADNAYLVLGYLTVGSWETAPNLFTPPGTPPMAGDYATKFENLVSYLELENIARTGLTMSALFVESRSSTSGSTVIVPANIPVQTATPAVWGGSFLLNLRYQLPIAALGRPYLGAEYLYSTKSCWPDNMANEDLTNFYSTRGRAFHIYYTQPIAAGLKLRAGFRRQNIFGPSGVPGFSGGGPEQDRYNTYYANLRLDF